MKFLRILMIAACFSASCSRAMEQEQNGKARGSILVPVAKSIIRAGALLAMTEGIAFASGYQPLFMPKMSDKQDFGAVAAIYLTAVSAGMVVFAYTL